MENYYSILDIAESASPDEIKRAYRTLVQVWHPDRFQHNPALLKKSEEKSKHINVAFGILSDATRRWEYDQRLKQYRKEAGSTTHNQQHQEVLATRCPNPSCDLSLRVKSRAIGTVTCPSCRTSFLYDPVKNEKWQVQYPAHAEEIKVPQEADPLDDSVASSTARRVTLIFLIVVFALVGSMSWSEIKRNRSVMLDVPTTTSPSKRAVENPPAVANTADAKATPSEAREERDEAASGPQTGEELIDPGRQ